jgi:hypothetical protein
LQQQNTAPSSSGIVAEAASYLDFGFFGAAAAVLSTPVKQSLDSKLPIATSSVQLSSSKLSPAAISFLRSLPDLSYMLAAPGDLDARE